MIHIAPASHESRQRDVKRQRFIMIIGNRQFHLTGHEVKRLRRKLLRFRLD